MTAYSSITNVGAQALAVSPTKNISLTRCIANTDTYLSLVALQGVSTIPSTGVDGIISSTKHIPASSSLQVDMSFGNTGDEGVEATSIYLCARVDGGDEIPLAIYYNDEPVSIPGAGDQTMRVVVQGVVVVSNDAQVTIEYSESEVQPSDLNRFVSRVKANGGTPDPEDIFGTKTFRGNVAIGYEYNDNTAPKMTVFNNGERIYLTVSGGPTGEPGTMETVEFTNSKINFDHLMMNNSTVLTQANLWDHCIPDNYSVGLQGILSSSVPVVFHRQDEIYTGKQITVGGTTYTLSIYDVDGEVTDHLYVTSKVSHTFNDGASSYASVPCVKAW